MDDKKTGGPAYPSRWVDFRGQEHVRTGMTLRDYFAARVLPKCIAEGWGEPDGLETATKGAYQIADAMLAAREVSGG